MLAREQVEQFKTLYKNRFGKDIPYEEALAKGIQLVRLMEIVHTPITHEDYEAQQKRAEELKQ